MKLRRLDWTTFHIPFTQPFATAHGVIHVREGLILRLQTTDGLFGLGEASAVPGFGGTLTNIITLLRIHASRFAEANGDGNLLETLDASDPSASAVGFSLDTALCDIRSQELGVPLGQFLGGNALRPIPVNATVGSPTTDGAVAAARTAVAAGFQCVKLKMGIAESDTAEIERVRAVRDAIGPYVRLRLDANGAWDVATAVRILKAIACFDPEYMEQPVGADDIAGMAKVRSAVSVRIAADESVGGLSQAQRVIEAGAADILIVKPMLAGGLGAARAIVELAYANGLGAVVTSTLDTGVGVAAALHLASTLADPLAACGLATGPLLAGDLVAQPLDIRDGAIRLPAGSGLGVTLDPNRVALHCDPWSQIVP